LRHALQYFVVREGLDRLREVVVDRDTGVVGVGAERLDRSSAYELRVLAEVHEEHVGTPTSGERSRELSQVVVLIRDLDQGHVDRGIGVLECLDDGVVDRGLLRLARHLDTERSRATGGVARAGEG
jgi:hypothetical protein